MPISNFVPRNMRMNVSQFFMYNLGLKNCDYNPDKQEIKEISKDSMQCCMNSIKETTEVDKFKSEQPIEIINPIETVPKLQHNFIPYPDHNYGQQPPLTPPEEAPKVEVLVEDEKLPLQDKSSLSDQTLTENEEEQEGVTRCICGFEHDDGYMICCDNCSSWQHIECMGIKSSKVPEKYSCHKCSPRELDIEGAKAIQAKKKENMSEDDDDEDEETCSEDETSNKTMYTAISNTPTRITLLSNSSQSTQGALKNKNRRANKVTKKKLSDQRNTRRKTKKKEKIEFPGIDANYENILFPDSNSLNDYISAHKLYEEIEENKYDEEFKNMHFKLPEAVPSIDFKNIVKCHQVLDVSRNRKGLVASFDIPCGNFILEYKGTLMSRKKFEDSCRPIFKNSCPYVVNYTKIDHMLLVIDARDYGNDARFVRRSCTPNAELQHITSNGALHIMIISKVNILQDKEITVPFDFTLDYYKGHLECACNLEGCAVKKQNEDLKQANKIINNTDLINNLIPPPPLPNESNLIKPESLEDALESENELNAVGEESKHEKLSREERKLQAYMKQFEKLERKQDTGKKTKEAKTPILKVTPDENTLIPTPITKPTPPKKVIGGKRKISFTGKRRTRQSSCSSEPVSPTEQQDVVSGVSTPTTPVVAVNTVMQLETTPHVLCRQRSRKEKEPLTLTLPIQRKLKPDQPIDGIPAPSPAVLPVPLAVSPTKSSVDEQAPLSLSVDTELETTPVKTNNLNGLLQIVQVAKTPVSTSNPTSLAASTCEEKIGDVTARVGETQPPPVPKPSPSVQREGNLQRRYYGSIKKHWLRQYSQNNTKSPNVPSNGFKQISLAALVASLSRQHLFSSVSPNPIVKSTPSLPLKRRHLLRATKDKETTPICNNDVLVSRMVNNNPDILMRGTNLSRKPCITEGNLFMNIISNVERGSPLTCSNSADYGTSSKVYTSNLGMEKRTTLPNKMENVLAASNTKLTYSLTQSLDSELGENITTIVNPLHSVISDQTSQLESMVEVSMDLQIPNTDFSNIQVLSGIDTDNKQLCHTNSEFQSGIEICRVAVNSNIITDSNPGNPGTLLVNSEETSDHLDVSDLNTITSELCSVIKTTNSQLHCAIESDYTQTHAGITTAYNELTNADTPLNGRPHTETVTTLALVVARDSVQNTVNDSSGVNIVHNVDNGEPSCKKQRVDVNEESSSELEIVLCEPNNLSESSFNPSSCGDNIDNNTSLISSQNDYTMQTLRPNSLGNDSLCNNPKYISTSPRNSLDNNLDTDSNSSISQGDAGTGGKKKLSFKEYRSRRSQKVPTCNITHLSTSSEHISHLPSMPISPAQIINQVAGLLLTPRTVSLINFERTADLYTNNLEIYMPISTQSSQQATVPETVTNGVSPLIDTNLIIAAETNSLSPGQIQEGDMKLDTCNIQGTNPLVIEPATKHQATDAVYGSNPSFEPVSPGNDYDSESPVDDSVAYLNTIHTDITKNPFSIHNDITKHPFGKKQNQAQSPLMYLSGQKSPHASSSPVGAETTLPATYRSYLYQSTDNRGSDVAEMDDDASSTHSNMSSTSYGSVSEVAHERTYPAHHRSYSREHSSREYSSREPPREGREYYPASSHPAFGAPPYYQGYNQSLQQPITRSSAVQRISGFSPHHNNYTLSSNQTPRQRQTHRGYIPF